MNHQPRHRSKLGRFIRHNRELVFISLVLLLILVGVGVIFWVMTSSRFVKGQ